jgi:preprotein translocase YajC subunit
MINLLGAESSNVGPIIGLGVCLVLLVLYVVFGIRNRKKSQEQAMKMMNELKVGDKVVTSLGIYGEVVAMRETNMGRVVTICTGNKEEGKCGYIELNAAVIDGIDTKEDLILDENGDVIEPDEKLKDEVLKENFEEKAEEETAKEEEKPRKIRVRKSKKSD